MNHKEIEEYLLSYQNTWLDYPFGKEVAVYKVGHKLGLPGIPASSELPESSISSFSVVNVPTGTSPTDKKASESIMDSPDENKIPEKPSEKGEGKMFALIAEGSDPVRISLKCDPLLAKTLREKYETVLPGYHLNKKHWNTIICSGQLTDDEIHDLIRHSYILAEAAK